MDRKRLLTVGEAAASAGVSVRTLRHYDEIGLLRPARVSGAGYRLYGEGEMRRLERILFFKELEFRLEEIRAIMAHPEYDERTAIARQLALMKKRRERIELLIARLEDALDGEGPPEFEVLDMEEIEAMKRGYTQEIRERWGNSKAYAQSEKRHGGYGKADYAAMQAEMNALFAQFAAVRVMDPAHEQVQALVISWKAHITKWHYDCTDEILEGLGQMYASDERFKKNIDKAGEGTANCMSAAIAAYCAGKHA